jgi:uncharacterized protein (DUF58 family)
MNTWRDHSRSILRDGFWRERIWRWLDRRQSVATVVQLQQKFMFVFPTRFGFSVGLLVLLLYVLGTNYQNNLILLQAYLLLVVLLSAIVLAFLNLHRTEISARAIKDVFAGEHCHIALSLHRADALPQALDLSWSVQAVVTPATGATTLLALAAPTRGRYQVPRLKLQSVYPFGLVRCWCYIRLDCPYWVYPSPLAATAALPPLNVNLTSPDEWSGQRVYQPGDSWRQLDWKRFSRQQQLLVHQFSATTAEIDELWLTLDPRLASLEVQLSDLTARALRADQAQQAFGLRLGHTDVPIGSGPAHLRQVLQALAVC